MLGDLPREDQELLKRYLKEATPVLREAGRNLFGMMWPNRWTIPEELRAHPERAVAVLAAALDEDEPWATYFLAQELLRKQLPFSPADASLLVSLVEARSSDSPRAYLRARAATAAIETRARAGEDVAALARRVLPGAGRAHSYGSADWTKLAARLRKLTAGTDRTLDLSVLQADDPWSEQVRPVLAERFASHGELLAQLGAAMQSKPSKRWLTAVRPLLDDEGRSLVRYLIESALEARSREQSRVVYQGTEYISYLWLTDMSATVVRGALWAASIIGEADWAAPACERLIARARQAEQIKVGNACFYCLGERADDPAVEVLARIVAKVKDRRFLKPAISALERAAEQRGISPEQLREQLVPAFGLDADGRKRMEIGPAAGTIQVVAPAKVACSFHVDGRETASAPAQLKDSHPDELAAFKRAVEEIRKELAVQRARLEDLLAAERSWSLADWRKHYLEQPLVQLFTRRLIWSFDGQAAIPLERDSFLTLGGQIEPPEAAEVRLWHPLEATPDEIAAWRALLRERELHQPFKQAYREIYLLAPAEQQTRLYSNRFAAHIVRYAQVYALAKQRGWGIRALGPYDNGGGEQWRDFPEQRLRAGFWMENADTDWGGGAVADFAATDQVRFTRAGERDPLPLDEVPRVVFSEAMRDVDLFVGVASIEADPNWLDGGIDRFRDYWREHVFGELGETALTRREALRELLPGLKIADRLELDDRYLRVRGNLHSYRIHLGSANILIEPHDRYLCIVPDRRLSLGKLFLPFEDERLSLILSKALLLAADDKIQDTMITRQLP